jgi:hypothetical protein
MPVGPKNVTFRVKAPDRACPGAVFRKKVPRLLDPLNEPTFRKVVPVKLLFPWKLNWGTPVIDPVVNPLTVTSSARACP